MTAKQIGEQSAFPIAATHSPITGQIWEESSSGLTKRELFAAILGAGYAAFGDSKACINDEELPKRTVELADALLAELAKPQ